MCKEQGPLWLEEIAKAGKNAKWSYAKQSAFTADVMYFHFSFNVLLPVPTTPMFLAYLHAFCSTALCHVQRDGATIAKWLIISNDFARGMDFA